MDSFFDRNGGLSKLMDTVNAIGGVNGNARRGSNTDAMSNLGAIGRLVQVVMSLLAA